MKNKEIIVIGANVHNLKKVNTRIPKNTLTVITGPSGSGKSSLAFDTIYVEGQRRYIESLSSYARQFLGQHQPPDVESIEGLSPAIAIDQKSTGKNPRSTVGTITEIYDYLRILFARVGTLYCPETGEEVKKHSPAGIVKELINHPPKTKIQLVSPLPIDGPAKEIARMAKMGFSRVRINGKSLPIDEVPKKLPDFKTLEVVIDRILIKEGIRKRLTDSVEYALSIGDGNLTALIGDSECEQKFSRYNKAPSSDTIYPDLEPRFFSFNSPLGACKTCKGLGQSKLFDESLIVAYPHLGIWSGIGLLSNSYLASMVQTVAEVEKVDIRLPYKKLPKRFRNILMNGSKKVYNFSFRNDRSHWEFSKSFPGIINWLEEKYLNTTSERTRKNLEQWMRIKICPDCQGRRLNSVALSTLISKKNIMDISSLTVEQSLAYINKMRFTGEKKVVSEKILKEIKNRLHFLIDVGLGYLSLSRPAMSLSGGEAQRIRLATQIGSALSGVLYVLDEPSIGLHQRDNHKLIKTLKSLRGLGNTILVVEHDEETMLEADYIIDLGPRAGEKGGRIVCEGETKKFVLQKKSLTSQYLMGEKSIPIPSTRRILDQTLYLEGASKNNLSNLDVEIPLGIFTVISGVSGSGKSTLMHELLVPICRHLICPSSYDGLHIRGCYKSLTGSHAVRSIIELDQSPIGRTPKSNPATYSKVFDEIRKLYAQIPEAKSRGYSQGRFSFNVKSGRCEECEGNGSKSIEMHFLPDVYITCDECQGKRYNRETLAITYKGKNIAEVLDLHIEEAERFFQNHPKIKRILNTLVSVGLGHLKLGQSATTLSGGEAQRLKLSRELAKNTRGHCLYVLDEPTTGLHFEDIKVLLKALNKLVDQGHTVLVIEHNLDIIKSADYVIDLGPEGGEKGGKVVAQGTPEEIAESPSSHTGKYLKKILGKGKALK